MAPEIFTGTKVAGGIAVVATGSGVLAALSGESVPAAVGAATAAIAIVWCVYSLIRDKRVQMAEEDVREYHRSLIAARKREVELQAELEKAKHEHDDDNTGPSHQAMR